VNSTKLNINKFNKMKRTTSNLLLVVLLFASISVFSAEKKKYGSRNHDFKGYIGISYGPSFSLGDFPADAKIGISSSFSFGYRFGKNWGLALNSFSTIQGIKNEMETSVLYIWDF